MSSSPPALRSAAAGATMSTSSSSAGAPLAIRLHDIAKAFGPVQANRGASLEVRVGEVHALVGENGAGKSTLMRLLSGMYAPDAGVVEVNGRDVTGWTTAQAIAAGVGMVHQHFMLVPTLTVAENVVLGREPTTGVWPFRMLDRAAAIREVEALSEETGLRVDPRRRVSELSVGEAQRVEILKVLLRGARILVLDEPTAVLSPPEVDELWRVLRRLRDAGGTIVLITHKLDEVIEVSDVITVMRAGRTVARLATRETTPQAIARAMVGRDVALALGTTGLIEGAAASPRGAPPTGKLVVPGETGDTDSLRDGPLSPRGAPPTGKLASAGADDDTLSSPAGAESLRGAPPTGKLPHSTAHTGTAASPAGTIPSAALDIRDLVVASARRPREVDGVTLTVAPGEILGIAGVEGNGQTELVEAIAGLRAASSGTIAINGRAIDELPVAERAAAGLSHIPEDRHRRGLVLDYSVADNLILGLQRDFTSGATMNRERIAEHARGQIARFDIRPADPALPARALSGGNQQKIVVAREMGRDFSVLLAAQPTRGVDVGAIEFIHAQLRAARDAGKAVLLVSAELNEILALADRVAVMYRGRVVAVLPRAEASEDTLGPWMTGASLPGTPEAAGASQRAPSSTPEETVA